MIIGAKVVTGPADMSQLPRIDPNDPNCPFSVDAVETVDGRKHIVRFKEDAGTNMITMKADPSRVPYVSRWPGIYLMGRLSGPALPCELRVDTGSPHAVVVTDLHVLAHKVPIYNGPGVLSGCGICRFPDIVTDGPTLTNVVAPYMWRHVEVQLAGLSIMKLDWILLGVPFLGKFAYASFDDVRREAEFSLAHDFDPPDPNAWSRYPFYPAWARNKRIVARIPVAGRNMNLMVDTGAQIGMLISEATWEKMRDKLAQVKEGGVPLTTPGLESNMKSRTFVVEQLRVGERTVKDARIDVVPNDDPSLTLAGKTQGVLGMSCFTGTTLVFDFKRELLWVKNPAGSVGP